MNSQIKKLDEYLEQFDYTYMMSDSHSVWQAGVKQEEVVRELIQSILAENPDVKSYVKDLILKHKPEYGTQFLQEVA